MLNQRALRPIAGVFIACLLLAGCGTPILSANTPADPSPTPTPVPAPLKIEVPKSIDATCQGAFTMKWTITNTSAAPLKKVDLTVLSSGKENIRYLRIDSTIYAMPLGQGLTFDNLLPNKPEAFTFEGDLVIPALTGSLRLQTVVKAQPGVKAFSTTSNTSIKAKHIGVRTTAIPPAKFPLMAPEPTEVQTTTKGLFEFYVVVYCDQVMINQNAPVNLTLTPTHATITSPKGAKDSKPGLTVQVKCINQIVSQTIKGNIVMPPQKEMQIKVDAVVPTTPPNADLNCPGVLTILKFPKGK